MDFFIYGRKKIIKVILGFMFLFDAVMCVIDLLGGQESESKNGIEVFSILLIAKQVRNIKL